MTESDESEVRPSRPTGLKEALRTAAREALKDPDVGLAASRLVSSVVMAGYDGQQRDDQVDSLTSKRDDRAAVLTDAMLPSGLAEGQREVARQAMFFDTGAAYAVEQLGNYRIDSTLPADQNARAEFGFAVEVLQRSRDRLTEQVLGHSSTLVVQEQPGERPV